MYMNQGYDQEYYEPNSDKYYDSGYYEGQEDSQLSKDQEEGDIKSLESNRLYLQKIRKQCALEDFSDLNQKLLLLFEIMIESLEVNSDSDLGLTPSGGNTQVYVTARAQFLNSPYLEISEEIRHSGVSYSSNLEQNYIQTVSNAHVSNITESYSPYVENSQNQLHSYGPQLDDPRPALICDVKWKHSTGKSCIFPMTALEVIINVDKYPVNIQVNRCIGQIGDGSPESSEPLGYCSIRLPDEFGLSVLQSLKPGVILPVTNEFRQTCDVRNVFGVKKGTMEVSIRLSTFGPVIITSVHSVGADRQYVFHPSPMTTEVREGDQETPRSDFLKPLVTEEENTIGLSFIKEYDSFQKPVMWKMAQHCCCLNSSFPNTPNLRGSEFDSIPLVRMPVSSEMNLCRYFKFRTDQKTLKKFPKDICDWHNLVSLEIKNNLVCNFKKCENCKKMESDLLKKLKDGRRPYECLPPITGLGIKPAPTDCSCPCPDIKKVLQTLPSSCL